MANPYVASNRYVINNDDQNLPTQHKTFEEAAASYLSHGGCNRFLPQIISYFEGRELRSIHPFDIRQMAEALYPDQSNATRNRQALSPVRAVITHAYERGWCNLMRLRRFKEDRPKRKTPASHVWLHAFIRQCDVSNLPHLSALILFMSQTGARISEAIRLEWSDVDFSARTALLRKTKTGTNSLRFLTDELIDRMRDLRAASASSGRVFRYINRHSVNERIHAVCDRAGISYKSSHLCGRHSFATNAIEAGMDIRTTMAAGDWKSSSIFLEIYVHPRQNAGRMVADRFNAFQFSGAI
jgi:integrase